MSLTSTFCNMETGKHTRYLCFCRTVLCLNVRLCKDISDSFLFLVHSHYCQARLLSNCLLSEYSFAFQKVSIHLPKGLLRTEGRLGVINVAGSLVSIPFILMIRNIGWSIFGSNHLFKQRVLFIRSQNRVF